MSLASKETDDTLGQSFKSLGHIEYVQQVKSVKERLEIKKQLTWIGILFGKRKL